MSHKPFNYDNNKPGANEVAIKNGHFLAHGICYSRGLFFICFVVFYLCCFLLHAISKIYM